MTVEYQVVNPATGITEARYPTATDAEVDAALDRAHAAFAGWRATPLTERVAVVRRIADLHEERADELARLITREMGKTTRGALGELDYVASIYRYYADNAAALLADEELPTGSGGRAVVRKSPLGVLLGVMPWNYPYYQVARFVAPNLLVGNTLLLKHAPQCPESALAMERLFHDAGVPADAYANLFATNEQVARLVADDRVRGVSVTGSERAGAAVAAAAGQHLTKVVLELGGSDAYLVLGGDLTDVARKCASARLGNGGQACNAGKRFIALDEVYDEFVDLLVAEMATYTTGDPTDPATSYGPLASRAAVEGLAAQVQDAVDRGATVRLGGRPLDGPGAYFPPTLLTDVTPEMRVFHEELFGPVAVVHRATSVDHAVELANDSPYGLGGAVFHPDRELALAVADRLDTGMVWINDEEGGGPELPFGGTKRSGVGRELGPYGMDEFVNRKLIHAPA